MSDVLLSPRHAPAVAARGALQEVARGLSGKPKTLPCKYFYDERGARLFEAICETEAYYPTRTEIGILRAHGAEMAALLGPRCRLVELGSGSGIKTRILLGHLEDAAEYVPVDISGEQLRAFADDLRREFPAIAVRPVRADYTRRLLLPEPERAARVTAAFFPGSTLGNFVPGEAVTFLRRVAGIVGAGGKLLLGIDLRKDPARIEHAYNDPEGITAAFNLNLLVHLNRICAADFHPAAFRHRAIYDVGEGRIEMHLVSLEAQTVTLGRDRPLSVSYRIDRGESIVTEYSYKYSLEGFASLAGRAGFEVERVWTDPEALFSVQLLRVADEPRQA
jgi:dimethylhistidine N-methyltransferase